MFELHTSHARLKIAQRGVDVPRGFENPFGKRDPYQNYELPNDGKGRKLNIFGTIGMPGEPGNGSSSAVGGEKFKRINPEIAHPYSETGDTMSESQDPDHPFDSDSSERPARSEYGLGGSLNFFSDDSPLSVNSRAFGSSGRDDNNNGPHGDIGGKVRSLMPKSS